MDSIKLRLDAGKVVGMVFLDLHKALDIVDHMVLFTKLIAFWYPELDKVYLANSQCVRINAKESKVRQRTIGVPQGSIFGPHCSVDVNDLLSVCEDVDIQMYIVIYTEGKDITKSISLWTLNVLQSFRAWKLGLKSSHGFRDQSENRNGRQDDDTCDIQSGASQAN